MFSFLASTGVGLATPSLGEVRNGRLRPAARELLTASWNIEGLTDEKVVAIQRYMAQSGVGVMCIQETHRLKSDNYVTIDGYLVVLSGSAAGVRERADITIITEICRQFLSSVFENGFTQVEGSRWQNGVDLSIHTT